MYWVRKARVDHQYAHLAKGSIMYGNVCSLYNVNHPGYHLVCVSAKSMFFVLVLVEQNLAQQEQAMTTFSLFFQ